MNSLKKYRFVIVADDFSRLMGGIENHALILGETLRNLGYEVKRSSFELFDSSAVSDGDIVMFDGINRKLLAKLMLDRTSKRYRKVVFTHGSFYDLQHSRELRKFGYRMGLMGNAKKAFDSVLMSRALKNMDAICTLSTIEERELLNAFHLDPTKVFSSKILIEQGTSRNGKLKCVKNPYESYQPYICAISRVHKRKNFMSALKAIEGMQVNFLLAGHPSNDLSNLLSYSASHHISNFHYLGKIEKSVKSSLLNGAIATIIPSFVEGVPALALESLVLGVPVIMTEFSYLPTENLADWGIIRCLPTADSIKDGIMRVTERNFEARRIVLESNESVVLEILRKLTDIRVLDSNHLEV